MKAKELFRGVLCCRTFLSPGVKASNECDNEGESPDSLVHSYRICLVMPTLWM